MTPDNPMSDTEDGRDHAPEPASARTLSELSRDECMALLRRHRFGRLAVTGSGNIPLLRPINYVFDDRTQSVAFRTDPGSKLHAVVRHTEAAFEIDGIDASERSGWSVIVSGTTEQVTNPFDRERLDRLGAEVWAPGERPHWVRIRARTVSGRRISQGDMP